ncbi:hypothetical protein EB796_006740 [Bugula neritina]|uniref:Uncharacterized protein n=1 Tax=Bugula neritina TaxID=10212 RepID=A0A7J7K8I6_BUGNE|nr:hypothetical protein EB796_006740 [Bugula neritina]
MGGPGDFFSQYARKQEMHTIEQTPLVGIAGLLPKENEAIDIPAKPQGTKLSAEDATSSISAQSLGLSESSVIQSAAVTPQHPLSALAEEFSSDSDPEDTHPNKFGIAIEEHFHRDCAYRRQPIRSGPQIKVIKKTGSAYNPPSLIAGPEVNQEQTRKYYRKDLVRICVCGRYDTKDALLANRGRDNDADGYEVHYNIKCRWKSYEDFKTKQRVLIRLCKCYKPSF